jgi:hypothetical protein
MSCELREHSQPRTISSCHRLPQACPPASREARILLSTERLSPIQLSYSSSNQNRLNC